MDLQEVGGGRGDWRELAQDRDGAAKTSQLLKDSAPWNKYSETNVMHFYSVY
jgi:hypothetical protein